MTKFFVSAWQGGVLQARHLIGAADETEAESLFLRRYPQYRGMAVICEGVWK